MMKFKLILIIIFFFLFLLPNNINAMLALGLAVNDKLKQCRTFQPTGKTELPEGWRYYSYEKSNYPQTHPETCASLGYIYSNGELKGVKSEFHKMINVMFIRAVLFLMSILLITIILIVAIIKFMRKIKRKKKIINTPKA